MVKRTFTAEEKAAILADYTNKEMRVVDVREKHGLSGNQLTRIILESGAEFRSPKMHEAKRARKNGKTRICPNCRRGIKLHDAKFCPYCAADIRSEADVLADEVKKLYKYMRYLPASDGDAAGAIIDKVVAYLRKQ